MADVWNSTKFKRLKDKWDEKLRNSGFEDIENSDGTLKVDTDPRTVSHALKEKESRETYYSIARSFLVDYEFTKKLEKDIWENHCEGIGARSIAKKLEVTTYRVESIITQLQTLAGLKRMENNDK